MTSTYVPHDLEELMTQAIDQRAEGPKLDFKQQLNLKGETLAELVKDVCAIVNTDDPDHYHGLGYLVIGVGGDGEFHPLEPDFNSDHLSASLNEKLNYHIGPPLDLRVVGPYKHERGQYAVVIIPDSSAQPHMVIRETGSARTGQWWVRRGTTTVLAGPDEYVRVLDKRIRHEIQPLRDHLGTTRSLLENLEARIERMQVRGLKQSGTDVADAAELSVAAKIRAQYGAVDTPLRQALRREVVIFLEAFEAEFPDAGIDGKLREPAYFKEVILKLEMLTQPLGEALAMAVMLGGGDLDQVVGQILIEVTQKTLTFPRYGSLSGAVEFLRAYPQVLLTLSVCGASVAAHRTEWLRPILATEGRHFLQNHQSHLLDPTRILSERNDLFEQHFGGESCTPAYQHINEVVFGDAGWLSGGDPFMLSPTLAEETEFLQSLICLDLEPRLSPIPNSVVYRLGGDQLLTQALSRDPDTFRQALKGDLAEVIKNYLGQIHSWSSASGRRFGCRPRLSDQVLKVTS